jgi:hypothetical protein
LTLDDVVTSACSLQATPVTETSTVFTTTVETFTSGSTHTTTVLALSTITATETVVATTTIKVAANAPSGAIGYLTFSPGVNAGADYALSDGATHMTDNFYQKAKRETFIVTADGYLYSVTNNSYYYISAGASSSLLLWNANKSSGMPIFSAGAADASGRSQIKMKDTSTGNFYNFCLKTSATGDGNSGTGLHIYGVKSGVALPASCNAIVLQILAV